MFDTFKAKMEGARHSATMKFNALMLSVGSAFMNLKDLVSSISDVIDYAVPSARNYLNEFQTVIDPTLFKYIGGTMAVLGIVNMFLRAKTKMALESRAPNTPTE